MAAAVGACEYHFFIRIRDANFITISNPKIDYSAFSAAPLCRPLSCCLRCKRLNLEVSILAVEACYALESTFFIPPICLRVFLFILFFFFLSASTQSRRGCMGICCSLTSGRPSRQLSACKDRRISQDRSWNTSKYSRCTVPMQELVVPSGCMIQAAGFSVLVERRIRSPANFGCGGPEPPPRLRLSVGFRLSAPSSGFRAGVGGGMYNRVPRNFFYSREIKPNRSSNSPSAATV